ncbi:FAD-dependent oxidoreductase [Hylemonella sp. W303a]|uniref:FAD-dependent oxidoreductase n=1 Tax=Hylemonella sp. W303a TaxID=3389873 RepID=UPI00396B188C
MEIAVIGAGIAGVTTAWELVQDGHKVTVFDRRLAVAEEGSFANSGLIAPSSLIPWADPKMPRRARRQQLDTLAPLHLTSPLAMSERAWRWKRALLSSSTMARRMSALRELARYSHERLHSLVAELELDFERTLGVLLLVRSAREMTALQPGLQLLRELGVPFQELSPEQARTIEPALNQETAFHCAIHLPNDEAGNCRQFAQMLKAQAQARGAQFVFGVEVRHLLPAAGANVTHLPARLLANMQVQLVGESQPRRFDAVVICAGAGASQLLKPLLRPLGFRLPLATTHSYAISAQVREPLHAPRSAVVDVRHNIALTRMGQRIRVGGGAVELGGRADQQHPKLVQKLYTVLHDWFPGAALLSGNVQTWRGGQVMLPDQAPLLGSTTIPGLWLNCAHGALGWTVSCGAARVLADEIRGERGAISSTELSIARLKR